MKSDASNPRFFVALLPPLEVQEYASQVIQELGDRYQTRTSKSPPHVTLQPPFQWQLQHIARLEQALSEFANQQSQVPVALSGFGAFAPRVLYINVLKTVELLALQTALATHLEETLEIVDPKSNRAFSPHLTVASRNLTRQTFKQAWTELQMRQVEFEFVGDRLTLLIHDGQRWQIRSEFPFHL
ncbi:2'-5' RNA ligase family protein [Cyanobacteria bacterium FACHB-471]|nr:2'-5' RNA ligase family protein [Cyanobacteria bacterium FACHB-471]